jgi:Rrf2 family cysteine metabolism transcriptional repressor
MLKLSTRSSYGVRAVFDLAHHPGDKPVRLAAIAERQKIPRSYLQQIFVRLRRSGIVKAIRGPKGGFQLGRAAQDIRIGDVVRALEGDFKPLLCTMPENYGPDCHVVEGCVSRIVCQKLDGQLNKILDSSTLAELCSEAERLTSLKGVLS